LARFALLKLRSHENDPRNWRPQIMLFAGEVRKRIAVVRLADWFNQDRGLVTVCQLVVNDLLKNKIDVTQKRLQMDQALKEENVVAFSEVDIVSEYESGAIAVVQANGIAGLHSNTVMFGWPTKKWRLESILRIMRAVSRTGRSTVLARVPGLNMPGRQKQIDIWWRGLQNNGDLMLLFAYLLSLNALWSTSKINVRTITNNEDEREKLAVGLEELVTKTRIKTATEVIVSPHGASITKVMHEHSRDADIVFLGLREPQPGEEAEYAERLIELAEGFHTTVFVHNAGEFAGHLI